MKWLFFFLNVLTINFFVKAQTRSVITPKGEVNFKIYNKGFIIVNKDSATKLEQLIELSKTSTQLVIKSITPTTNKLISIMKFSPQEKYADIKNYIETLRKEESINSIGNILVYTDGTLQGVTNRISCRLKVGVSYNSFISLLKSYSIDSVVANKYLKRAYMIYLGKNKADAVDISNILNQTNLFDYSDVDWLRLMRMQTPDPLFTNQWNLSNSGASIQYSGKDASGIAGADMKVPDAWKYSTGKGIKVAIIDEGVDLKHPDLISNLLPGFDATEKGSMGGCQGDDAHGTSCAGIVGAAENGIGILGVAYDCKIIPVRIAYNELKNGTNTWIADSKGSEGLLWAAFIGNADVLSCSWVGGSDVGLLTAVIDSIADYGRGGKGAVILFACGNYNLNEILFPSNLSNVIAVGASTMCDTRKSSSNDRSLLSEGVVADRIGVSCDSEVFWGSDYGPGLSVVAPGVRITTTDISGPAGYNKESYMRPINNDYISAFNGTSAACPNVAGVMALILSADSNLTRKQAKRILEITADKVGNYTFITNSEYPNGTWNDEVGYGRVNAYKAVLMAKEMFKKSQSALIASPQN